MGLRDLIDQIPTSGALPNKSVGLSGLSGAVKEKIEPLLDQYKKATKVLETFGFRVDSFTVGMGLLPEIDTSLSGSIERIQVDALQKMADEHKEEKLLVGMLNALITTRQFWEHVELRISEVTLDVRLGLTPTIKVNVHESRGH
jgi:hypothetical protein